MNAAATRRWGIRIVALAIAAGAARLVVPWWCGRDAAAWLRGDPEIQRALASELVAFEAAFDAAGKAGPSPDRFTGEWALVTHQMTALGLAQLCLAHPAWRTIDRGLAGLAIAALVLRVAVLVAVPAVIAYRITRAVLRRLVARSGPAPRDARSEQAEPPR